MPCRESQRYHFPSSNLTCKRSFASVKKFWDFCPSIHWSWLETQPSCVPCMDYSVPHGPPARIDMGLKRLMGEVTSKAAGCMYCTAHCAQGAAHHGVSQDKVDAVWEFETSALFSDAERAALQVALLAGHSSSQVEDEHFARLRRYYDDDQIIEIMSVISCFGFLNRWNDTLATRLEDTPLQYAKEHVTGWEPGKHRP